MEIRSETYIIIRKNRLYLQGVKQRTWGSEIIWTVYRHEAWRTRNMEDAEDVARKVGGIMMMFNPILGKTKVMGC